MQGSASQKPYDRNCGDVLKAAWPLLMPGKTDLELLSCQVWDYRRSAEMRDTEGGASKRSVLQQAEKLKSYLEQEGLA